jgi:uncharacterized membrane protein YfcA
VLGGVALRVDDTVLRRVLGIIVLSMVGLTVRHRLQPATTPPGRPSFYGIVAGFATTIANAAGPVMASYLLLQRMPKERLVATGAWFFLTVNLAKLPIYWVNGLLEPRSLTFDAMMAPLVICGAFGGFALMRRLSQRMFEGLTLALAALSSLFLFV